MGLDTSHDCWHGAYSAFSRWRNDIALAAGYAIWPVRYDDGITRETIMIDWGHVTEDNLAGKWQETPSDPLVVLIAHSDCDGVIYPEQAIPLADRLEGLLPKIEGMHQGGGHISARGGLAEVTRKFIVGLRNAAGAGEVVDFH